MMREQELPVLITGATGLVGVRLVKRLIAEEQPVYALVRNAEKARRMLGEHPLLTVLVGDVRHPPEIPEEIGAIVHGANPTSSRCFVDDPCGVIDVCVNGTRLMLELARVSKVQKFVYLSSGEVYGYPLQDTPVKEDRLSAFDPLVVRSSYPEAKRMCETLCAAYHAQFGVPAVVARLGVIFGPLTDAQDNRLLAQFARCVRNGEDIVLQTEGGTVRSYCDVDDVAAAVCCLLECGEAGTAYNIANPALTMSVRELAVRITARYPRTDVRVCVPDLAPEMYLPELRIPLDVSRLLALGWEAHVGLETGFEKVLASLEALK